MIPDSVPDSKKGRVCMQLTPDLAAIANLSSAVFSVALSMFLLALWSRQKNHLYTDLPLLFGIMFFAQALNSIIRTLPTLGIIEASLDLFRLRSLVILAVVFPLTLVALNIWLPRIRNRYSRVLAVLALYWVAVTLLAPSEGLIMLLCIPILLVLDMTMVVTFSITWKTGRLKEVRSSLMVLAFLLGFVSQLFTSMVVLDNVLLAMATGIMTLAVINPWFRRRRPISTNPIEAPASVAV
jgi:hypothetical protein